MALDVDATTVSGIWWRHLPHGSSPYHRPGDAADGRWNRGRNVEGWYFADSPETVWAEWYRYLTQRHLRPDVLLPRDLWRWRIDLDEVADLRTNARLARVGLDLPAFARSHRRGSTGIRPHLRQV